MIEPDGSNDRNKRLHYVRRVVGTAKTYFNEGDIYFFLHEIAKGKIGGPFKKMDLKKKTPSDFLELSIVSDYFLLGDKASIDRNPLLIGKNMRRNKKPCFIASCL